MTWGKVDDKLHTHPKPEQAKLEAMGLWVIALSHCCDSLTDGHVTRERVGKIADSARLGEKLAATLCRVKLWHLSDEPCSNADCEKYRRPGTGFRFHDWENYQPTRARIEEERVRKQEAGKRGGEAKARASKNLAPASQPLEPSYRKVSTSDPDPDPDPDPVQNQKAAGSPKLARQVVLLVEDDLPPAELAVFDAIEADVSLKPISRNIAQLAHDLTMAGPGIDVALEVQRAGAWLRANPTRAKKNGNKYLVGWINRQQEKGGVVNRGNVRGPVREKIPEGGPVVHSGNVDIASWYDARKNGDLKSPEAAK